MLLDEHQTAQLPRPGTSLARPMTGKVRKKCFSRHFSGFSVFVSVFKTAEAAGPKKCSKKRSDLHRPTSTKLSISQHRNSWVPMAPARLLLPPCQCSACKCLVPVWGHHWRKRLSAQAAYEEWHGEQWEVGPRVRARPSFTDAAKQTPCHPPLPPAPQCPASRATRGIPLPAQAAAASVPVRLNSSGCTQASNYAH